MSLLYKAASLAICRSGAGTVNEMEAMGMPAVYVPLPIGNGEQKFNAKPVVDNGGGIMVQDSRFTEGFVKNYIPPLITNEKKLEEKIAELLEKLRQIPELEFDENTDISEILARIDKYVEEQGIVFVNGRGHRKTAVQRIF